MTGTKIYELSSKLKSTNCGSITNRVGGVDIPSVWCGGLTPLLYM